MSEGLSALRRFQTPRQGDGEDQQQQQQQRLFDDCCISVVVLRDTCSFMNATINRCLDYGKATVGMALCPLQDSVHLHEALSWVVNCVNRTQEGRVSAEEGQSRLICMCVRVYCRRSAVLTGPARLQVMVVMEEVPPRLCSHITTDHKWLEENLLCLTSNAVKFQEEGSGIVSVRCSLVEGGGTVCSSSSRRSVSDVESASGEVNLSFCQL